MGTSPRLRRGLPAIGGPPGPSTDRSTEFRSTLLIRLDSLALVAHATRRGRLSARQHWWGPPSRQQPRGGRWRPVTEDGPATADLSAHGQGGALSPQRCLYITGLELFHLLVIAASAELRFDAVRWRAEAHRYVCDAVRQVSSTSSSAGKDDYMYARRR